MGGVFREKKLFLLKISHCLGIILLKLIFNFGKRSFIINDFREKYKQKRGRDFSRPQAAHATGASAIASANLAKTIGPTATCSTAIISLI